MADHPPLSDRERAARPSRRVIVLGSTGSVGTQALGVIAHLNALHARDPRCTPRYDVVGLAAGQNATLLAEQAACFGVTDLAASQPPQGEPGFGPGRRVRTGPRAAAQLVEEIPCDLVIAAIVGIAGLEATMIAIQRGTDVALANKETLVAAGSLVVPAAHRSGAALLPIDSEHAALWQCLRTALVSCDHAGSQRPPMRCPPEVDRVFLTASGGPFRTATRESMERARPSDALRHPTWAMGKKVTIDSASMMNKALEVIEAHWLFGLAGERIEVVVHPQSIVHAMAELSDGSVIAQLAMPDMRVPIQQALTFPDRVPSSTPKLDWRARVALEFEPPDTLKFPALGLAYDAIRAGGSSGVTLNAANEIAVEAFLAERIPFGRIAALVAETIARASVHTLTSLDDVMQADRDARRIASELLRTAHL